LHHSPYKYVGTWLVDQWSKIGVTATQRVQPTGPWLQAMRTGDLDVVVEANCNSVVNPVLDKQKYLPREEFAAKYGGYSDPEEVDIDERMLRETDFDKQRPDAAVRDTHHRYRSARVSDAVVVPYDPRTVLCSWVEDRPQPFHQPGSVQHLA
jgi:peptide/nickel transport system substrate-binding protein